MSEFTLDLSNYFSDIRRKGVEFANRLCGGNGIKIKRRDER